jgi:hypothetical protein
VAATLKIKNSSTPTTVPPGLTAGEMAVNLADKKLYIGGTGGTNVIFLDSTSVVGTTAGSYLSIANNAIKLDFQTGATANLASSVDKYDFIPFLKIQNPTGASAWHITGFSGPTQLISVPAFVNSVFPNLGQISVTPSAPATAFSLNLGLGDGLTQAFNISAIGVTAGAKASLFNLSTETENGSLEIGVPTVITGPGVALTVNNTISVNNLDGITDITSNAGNITIDATSGVTFTGNISARNIVNSFNGVTGALQGVSAAVAGTGISVSGATGAVTITNTGVQTFNGATGAVTGVSSFNGLTGAVGGVTTSVANTFTALNTFSSGISVGGGLTAVNINTTGFISINNTPATLTTTTAGNATVFNTVATSLGIGGAATAITMGATTGTLNLRNPTIIVGNTVASITTASGTGNTLTVSPFGSVVIAPTSTSGIGGTRPSLTVTNADQGMGTVSVSGGLLVLGTLEDGEMNTSPVYINFKPGNTGTILFPATPTENRFITLPDASGTVALTTTVVSSAVAGTGISVSGATGAVTITNTGVRTFNGATGAVTGVTVGGANTFTQLNTFSAGISASGATFSGNISAPNIVTVSTANTFTQLNTFSAGISASGATFSGSISGATATFSKDIKVNTMTVGLGKSSDTTNVAIGVGALASDTSDYDTEGVSNTAIGSNALNANTTGSSNVGVGQYALFQNTTGGENVGVGTNAFYTNTTGSSNVGVGQNALFQNTTGSSNVGVGQSALALNNTGSSNVGVGQSALFQNTTGSNKTAIGYLAGAYRGTATDSLSTGTGGIYIGYQARGSTLAQTNEIVIGVNALGLGSNTAVIGATLQSAATIYGVLNLPSGLSASGATFSGPIISTGYQISSGAINGQTGSYSLVAGDNGKIVTMNVASANNLTVPASLAVGFNCTVIQLGAGQTTILASGTTLNSYQGYLKISGQHGSASIVGYTSNVYNVAGNLSA